MSRAIFLGGGAVLAALAVALAALLVNSPVSARRRGLEAELEAARRVEFTRPPRVDLPYDRFHQQITGKTALWSPVAEAPQAPEKPPEWDKILQNVRPTRQQIGAGPTRKVKVMMGPNDRQGRWVTVGENINGATVSEITDTHIVFRIQQGGKEYTHNLGRS